MALPFESIRARLPQALAGNLAGRLLATTGIAAILGGFVYIGYALREPAPRIIGVVDGGTAGVSTAPVAAAKPANTFTDRRQLAPPMATPVAPAAPSLAAAAVPVPPASGFDLTTATAAPKQTPQITLAPAPIAAAAPAATATAPAQATPAAPATTVAAVAPQAAPAPRFAPHSGCGQANVSVTPRDAGIMGLRIESACRAGEFMQIRYGGLDFIRKIGDSGILFVDLDLFAGVGKAVDIVFHDGSRKAVPADAKDMDRISKVALFWRSPINLDLHAFEYAAAYGEAGHRWSRIAVDAASTIARAKGGERGQGYVSTAADGTGAGLHMEVYTFVHADNEPTGSVALAIDYETRGDAPAGDVCGAGELAKINYEFRVLARDGQTAGGTGTMRSVPCGVPLAQAVRYQQAGLPTLRFRKP